MSHPINDQIFERISEEYQIYQMIIEIEGNIYPQIRYVIRERSCFADQDLKLVRHDHKTSWSSLVDAQQALSEIVQKRFEEQAQ